MNFLATQSSVAAGTYNALAWLGQGGFALCDKLGTLLYVDPYLSNVCAKYSGNQREVPAPIAASDVKADFVLFTHDHRDHVDPESVPEIAKSSPSTLFVGPSSCVAALIDIGVPESRVQRLDRGQVLNLGTTSVKAVPAYHTQDSVGYIFELDDITIYITGDTVYRSELEGIQSERPNIVMVCINGRLGNMNTFDAVRLVQHIQPDIAIPMHYGMFKRNTASPSEFVRLTDELGAISKGTVLEHGMWYLVKRIDTRVILEPFNS